MGRTYAAVEKKGSVWVAVALLRGRDEAGQEDWRRGAVCEENMQENTTEDGYCQVLCFIGTVRTVSRKAAGFAREVQEKKEVRRQRVASRVH